MTADNFQGSLAGRPCTAAVTLPREAGVSFGPAKPLAMTMHEASRTLVKSTPELWAECSDGDSLARHLGAFGEIRITKLEPETAVAWEGDEVRGTVTLEPSGWGTRVVLTATPGEGSAATGEPEPVVVAEEVEPVVAAESTPEAEPASEPQAAAAAEAPAQPESEPASEPEAEPVARPGFFARLFGRRRRPPSEPEPLGDEDPLIELARGAEPEPEPERAKESLEEPAAESVTPPDPPSPPPPELEVLLSALDSLGTAHRRPFSRS
jgi:hypothetical protein